MRSVIEKKYGRRNTVTNGVNMGKKVGRRWSRRKKNQSPKGIIWSAVPLPCFFVVMKSQRVAGQRPREGTKSCRMGRNSVRPSIRLSIRPSVLPSMGLPKGSEAVGVCGPARGGTNIRTDRQMYGKTGVWNFSPFYRTLSPVGVAALLPSETSQHQRCRARELLTIWCLLATGFIKDISDAESIPTLTMIMHEFRIWCL